MILQHGNAYVILYTAYMHVCVFLHRSSIAFFIRFKAIG